MSQVTAYDSGPFAPLSGSSFGLTMRGVELALAIVEILVAGRPFIPFADQDR